MTIIARRGCELTILWLTQQYLMSVAGAILFSTGLHDRIAQMFPCSSVQEQEMTTTVLRGNSPHRSYDKSNVIQHTMVSFGLY